MATYKRDLNNLYGDAQSVGAELLLQLVGFGFTLTAGSTARGRTLGGVELRYSTHSTPGCEEAISRALRAMGWKTEIVEAYDGTGNRVWVRVEL